MRASKTLHDLPDPWGFELVLTVCDAANEACPAYPARTTRLHVSFPRPQRPRPRALARGARRHRRVQPQAQPRPCRRPATDRR